MSFSIKVIHSIMIRFDIYREKYCDQQKQLDIVEQACWYLSWKMGKLLLFLKSLPIYDSCMLTLISYSYQCNLKLKLLRRLGQNPLMLAWEGEKTKELKERIKPSLRDFLPSKRKVPSQRKRWTKSSSHISNTRTRLWRLRHERSFPSWTVELVSCPHSTCPKKMRKMKDPSLMVSVFWVSKIDKLSIWLDMAHTTS